jgi:signal transduction histidine kinase
VVNIGSAIPQKVFGDVVRVRQIPLNLLSNAAKHTNAGNIILTADREEQDDESLTLQFEIARGGKRRGGHGNTGTDRSASDKILPGE